MTYLPEVAWALQERDAKGADSNTKDGHLIVGPLSAGAGTNRMSPGHNRDDLMVIAPTDDIADTVRSHPRSGSNSLGNIACSLTADGFDASEDGTGRGTPLVALDWTQNGAAPQDDLSPSLRVGSGIGLESSPAINKGASVRRLTPTECERLQGFPDGFTDGQSDSARYRQLGNAVAVPVVEWIAHRIVAVDAELRVPA